MEEKKEIKVSLGTVICSFVIVVLLIALGCLWLNYKKLENSQNKVADTTTVAKNNNTPVKTTDNTKQNNITLELGIYVGNTMIDDIDFSQTMCGGADDFMVMLYENNECNVYEGVGTSHLGTYKIENNKLICHTVVGHGEEGASVYWDEDEIFEYDIINKKTIKLTRLSESTDDYARKIGRIFTLEENNNAQQTITQVGENEYEEFFNAPIWYSKQENQEEYLLFAWR